MTYVDFLLACRKIAGQKKGLDVMPRAEFAKLCGQHSTTGKKYSEAYYRHKEEGYTQPGRELLEAAALAAGFKFQDCIHLPVKLSAAAKHASLINSLVVALADPDREAYAARAVHDLATMKREKKR